MKTKNGHSPLSKGLSTGSGHVSNTRHNHGSWGGSINVTDISNIAGDKSRAPSLATRNCNQLYGRHIEERVLLVHPRPEVKS